MARSGGKPQAAVALLLAGLAGAMAAPLSAEEGPGSDALTNGKRIFRSRCQQCHTIAPGAGNSTGPNLAGVAGRGQASVEGFSYSEAFSKQRGVVWSADRLDQFLAAPQKTIPGTLMVFPGLRRAQERHDLILFLQHPE